MSRRFSLNAHALDEGEARAFIEGVLARAYPGATIREIRDTGVSVRFGEVITARGTFHRRIFVASCVRA